MKGCVWSPAWSRSAVEPGGCAYAHDEVEQDVPKQRQAETEVAQSMPEALLPENLPGHHHT